jgi:uncharacterized membrane protein
MNKLTTPIGKLMLALAAIAAGSLDASVALAQNILPAPPPSLPTVTADSLVSNIVSILSIVSGAASVIVIVIAGIMYTTSAGNEKRITTAKDAILYAVVGLIISLLAFAIVNFVITGVTTGTPT